MVPFIIYLPGLSIVLFTLMPKGFQIANLHPPLPKKTPSYLGISSVTTLAKGWVDWLGVLPREQESESMSEASFEGEIKSAGRGLTTCW